LRSIDVDASTIKYSTWIIDLQRNLILDIESLI